MKLKFIRVLLWNLKISADRRYQRWLKLSIQSVRYLSDNKITPSISKSTRGLMNNWQNLKSRKIQKNVRTNYWKSKTVNGWTLERRKRQAKLIRQWRPWDKSSGPKTQSGKKKSSQNARKDSMRSTEMKQLCYLLAEFSRTEREARKTLK